MTKNASLATGNRRLLKLADHLDTVHEKEFNMNSWLSWLQGGWVADPRIPTEPALEAVMPSSNKVKPSLLRRHECGYAACAAGHACMIPSFRKAGLRMELEPWPYYEKYNQGIIKYGDLRDWRALEAFFHLDDDESTTAFGADEYDYSVKPAVVADGIRKLVAGRTEK